MNMYRIKELSGKSIYRVYDLSDLDSKELVLRRQQVIRDKQTSKNILKTAISSEIKSDIETDLKFYDIRLEELNLEIERRANALSEKNKVISPISLFHDNRCIL